MKQTSILVLGALVLLGLVLVITSTLNRPRPTAFGLAPAFNLRDSENRVFDSKALEGKVWVADFFFSTCAGPCPRMAKNMQTLATRFPDGNLVRLVNFTVNPGYDTPEILNRYAAKLQADTERWHFLTGPEEELIRISSGGFYIGDSDNLLQHSKKFVLVDRHGLIRGYYDGTDPHATEQLILDIERLL